MRINAKAATLIAALLVSSTALAHPHATSPDHPHAAPASSTTAAAAASHASALDVARSLLMLREAAGLSVSPSGRYAAYQIRRANLQTNSYDAWWEVRSLDGPVSRVRVDDGGDPTWGRVRTNQRPSMHWDVLTARWSPDETWIAYLKRHGGEVQIWRARIDGAEAMQVTHAEGDVLDFVWSPDGRSIIYTTSASRKAADTAFEQERKSGFLLDDRFDPVTSWEPIRTRGNAPPPCCESIDVVTGQTRAATSAEIAHFGVDRPPPAHSQTFGTMLMWTARTQGAPPPAFAPASGQPPLTQWERRASDGSSILLAFADSELQGISGPVRLFARASEATPFVACSEPTCAGSIAEAWRAPNGDVVYSRREGYRESAYAFYAWRPGQAPRRLFQTQDLFYDCNQAQDRLICFTEGTLAPQTMVSIDMQSGARTTLLDLNPEYDRAARQPAERLEWTSPAGHQDFGYFIRPAGNVHKPYPLVIVQYRAVGFLRGGQGDFSPIQAYARAGLGVFMVDRPENVDLLRRVADDVEIERQSWQGLRERRDIFAALERGIDLLVRRGDVDPHRIGISGLSDGAATTEYAVGHSNRFRAASVSGGSWEPILFYMASPQARAELTLYGMGQPGSSDDRSWDGVSMTRNAAAINTPLLIQSADREIGMFLQPLATLQSLHKPVEAYVFSDEYHVMWQPQHRMAMYERNLDWFRFWLQGYEDPNPGKREQYLRWHLMRDAGASGASSPTGEAAPH